MKIQKREIYTFLSVTLFAILTLFVLGSTVALAQVAPSPPLSFCLSCLQFRVGPAELILGPSAIGIDNPFAAINVSGLIRGYTANGTTYKMDGSTVENLALTGGPVISGGPSGNFDECGAWLQALEPDGSIIRGRSA